MAHRVKFTAQGPIGRWLDHRLQPLMYWLQGTKVGLPQRTHFWNNKKFQPDELSWLDQKLMVRSPADPKATSAWKWGVVPIFHMPRFGGWKQFVVVRPVAIQKLWYVGWTTDSVCGLSLIPIRGQSVRLLRGPTETCFFGVNEYGTQIELIQVGEGRISDYRFSDIPLR